MSKRHLLLSAAILAALPFVAEGKRPNSKLNGIEVRNTHEPVIRPSSGDLTNIITKRTKAVVVIPDMPTTILDWWMGPRVGTWPVLEAGIMPAIYAEKGLREPMVGVPLAGKTVAANSLEQVGPELERWGIDAEAAAHPSSEVERLLRRRRAPEEEIQRILEMHNPQGWHVMGKRIHEQGWQAMDRYMSEFEQLDPPIKTVWFWNWSGVDSVQVMPEGARSSPMGWPDTNSLPQHLIEDWQSWSQHWRERGFKFGVWASTPAYPNTGTWDQPVRKWLKYTNEDGSTYVMDKFDPNAPADINWFVDHMAELHEVCGFDFIGLDAANHLFELRDEPPHRQLNYQPAGPREPGIMTAFLAALVTDPRLENCQIVAESHLPPNHFHALVPTLFTVSSVHGSKNTLPDIGDEEHHKLIPGCETITHMFGNEWTESEWPTGTWPGPVYEELLARGYTPTVTFPTLVERVILPLREQGYFDEFTPAAPGASRDTTSDASFVGTSGDEADASTSKNKKKKKNKKKRRKLPVKTWR